LKNQKSENLKKPFCDWLSFTIELNEQNLEDSKIFGDPSQNLKGYSGYNQAYISTSGALIAWNKEKPELRLYISLSAKALYSQSMELEFIISWAIDRNGKFTRIDLAKDDYDEILNINEIYEKIKNAEITTRFRNYSVYSGEVYSMIESGKIGSNVSGKTIYLGNLKDSNTLVRIYDKGAKEKTNYHWIRVEYQFRRKVANQYCNPSILIDPETGEIAKRNNSEKIILGHYQERNFEKIALYYLRFLDITRGKSNKILHKRHWETSNFWTKFLDTEEKNKIGLPKYKTGLEDLKAWATRSISGLNYLLETAYGQDYKNDLKREGKEKFENNQYYQQLIRDKNKIRENNNE
jgi:phage replication initiation protein